MRIFMWDFKTNTDDPLEKRSFEGTVSAVLTTNI